MDDLSELTVGRVAGTAINNHEERVKALEAQAILGSITDICILISVYLIIHNLGKVKV